MTSANNGGRNHDRHSRHSVAMTTVVIRDDGRVLVIRRADGERWVPPGGVLELGEALQERRCRASAD
jgi:8-oxo-dGTP pyrophosphatase MutT (NUDIX family)